MYSIINKGKNKGGNIMIYNEDSRVKLPALLHFCRLGYKYESKKNAIIDKRNNIFVDIFRESLSTINEESISNQKVEQLLREINMLTDNEKDKGKSFFNRLMNTSTTKLIDLRNPRNNDFRVVSELTFQRNGKEFRPDITVLINGIPLSFIEVKKPNNSQGIQVEFNRNTKRMDDKDFVPFFNQFQIISFTNNLEYNDDELIKMTGSFYSTPNSNNTTYNHFREEEEINLDDYISEEMINFVLKDNNKSNIKDTNEFFSNLKTETPCNKFITSIFSIERLIFLIRYGIVYVDSLRDGLNKHIIRYPQFFAIQNLIKKIDQGLKRGVLWHTQGSGKTAFSYFAANVLRDYYQEQNIITKFYFVVDRLDLLNQSSGEFVARGMTVSKITNRKEFINNIKSPSVISSTNNISEYKETMNVINIQNFSDEAKVDETLDYRIQRIYFLDEVHRSYKPKGTFLSNLLGMDPNGLFIGLTGTPIIKDKFKTTDLFTEYIHKYYYNKSIADGYTLKMKKDNISTDLKIEMRNLFDLKEEENITTKKWEEVGKNQEFVHKVCEYIEEDFDRFSQVIYNDNSLAYMIVASSSDQARAIQSWFDKNSKQNTALVLYDEEDNKTKQDEYRGIRQVGKNEKVVSKYNGVIVYNMLLTGFDVPRLKRLYLLRKIKEHSLLQTLSRVNRPYKDMRYGYIVDFVDITEEYEETNQRYLQELREDFSDENIDIYIDDMFVDVEKVKEQLVILNKELFFYMINIESNLEDFRKQIEIMDETSLRKLRMNLTSYRECYNELKIAREDVNHMPIERIKKAFSEVDHRINFLNDQRNLSEGSNNIDSMDLSGLVVEFIKIGEVDLDFKTENEIQELVQKIKNQLSINIDKKDKKIIELNSDFRDAMLRLKNEGNTVDKINDIIKDYKNILDNLFRINDYNKTIKKLYFGNEVNMRFHKRLIENYLGILDEQDVHKIIISIEEELNSSVGGIILSPEILKREMMRPVKKAFSKQNINLSKGQVIDIINLYIEEKFL